MGVLALWVYPVKAMLGQALDAVEVSERGFECDRAWVVVDSVTGERIANKRGPTDPRVRACRAALVGGLLQVTLPDGTVASGEDDVARALTELLGREVRLERFSPSAEPGRFGAPAAWHDFGPVHLITSRTLAAIGEDARRFRPNVVLDDGAAPPAFGEDELIGRSLVASDGPTLSVGFPTPRCVVPTRASEDLPREPKLLKRIARDHMVDIPGVGRFPCAGAYAEVARPGRLRVGDRLAVA